MPNKSLQFHVYTPAPELAFIDNLPNAISPSYLEELKADGGGSFRLPVDDPRVIEHASVLDPLNVIKAVVNGEVRGAFFLRQQGETLVTQGEHAGRLYEFSGPGLKGWLAHASVYATQVLSNNKKLSNYRYFNFASPGTGTWYNPSDWEAATAMSTQGDTSSPWKTAPVGWPDAPGAKWIWDRDAETTAPVGDVYFRKEFTLSAQRSVALFATADDSFEAYIDGVPVLAIREPYGWTGLWRGDIDLPAGTHTVAVKATNSGGPAGMLAALFSYTDPKEQEAATLITKTGDSGWLVNGYPSSAPGWTPGEVIRTLFEEALARASDAGHTMSLQAITLDFTDELDSNGQPWEVVLDWAFEIGSNYDVVMKSLSDLAIEWEIDPVSYTMRVYNQRGTDKSVQDEQTPPVILRPAFNVTQAGEEREYDVKNVVLLEYGDQLLTEVVGDAESLAKYGRIESYMSADAEMSKDRALFVASKFLELNATPIEGASVAMIDRDGHTPWDDFTVGDYIKGPTTKQGLAKRRVVGLAVIADQDSGTPNYEVVLDTLLQERADRIEALLARIPSWTTLGQRVSAGGGAGSGGGGGGYNSGGDYDGGYYGGDIGDGYYGGGPGYGGGGWGGGGVGGALVYVQPNDPGSVPIGTLWYDTDGQVF